MRKSGWHIVVLTAVFGMIAFGTGIYWSLNLPQGLPEQPPGAGEESVMPDASLSPDRDSPEAEPQPPVTEMDPKPPIDEPPIGTLQSSRYTILALGDSLAAGTGAEAGEDYPAQLGLLWQQSSQELTQVINLARRGLQTGDVLSQIQAGIPRAELILVSAGGNNIVQAMSQGAGPEEIGPLGQQFIRDMGQIITALRAENPGSTILVLGLYNPFAYWLPQGIAGWPSQWNQDLALLVAHDPLTSMVPIEDIFQASENLSYDLVHPDAEGYRLVAQRHYALLKKGLQDEAFQERPSRQRSGHLVN